MGQGIFRFTRVAIISCLFLVTTLWLSGCRGLGASPSGSGTGGGGSSAPTIVSFTASSTSASPGTSVNLTWKTTNATQVSISPGIGTQPANGSVTVTPSSSTTYTLTAQGNGGQATATVTVNVKAGPPTVQVTASPTTITNGQISVISWTTTNATAINFNPVIPGVEGSPLSLPTGNSTVTPTQTTTYVATVTGPGGSATASVTVTVNQVPPTIMFSANPTSILSGQSSTLSWTTSNATSVSIDNGVGNNEPTTGSVTVSPTSTTTYTLTATGLGGTMTAQTTVTVASTGTLAVTITANPASISQGQSTTLTWQSQNAVSVDVEPAPGPNQPTSGSAAESPTSNTTYTATATDAGGNTATSSFTVTVIGSGDMTKIKHIIFYVQENRSFDMYFGELGNYRQNVDHVGSASDLDTFNPNVTLTGIQGIQRQPYHQRTVQTDDLTPSWNESHFDLDRPSGSTCTPNPNSNCKMDRFMITTSSIPAGRTRDPNGDRALGYYDQTDLPYYYELATQFATSDRWFSPLLSQTIPNRMYLFAATSFGHIRNADAPPPGGWTQPTIFDALDKAGISWRYYYLDNSVYLPQWSTYQKDSGKVVSINAPTLGWFQVLGQSNADQLLPQVIFIERGSNTGLDEHPDANIQKGAATVANIVNALLKSPAWATSAMIFTYDEGGGLYDHVPPFSEVEPDAIQPMLQSGDTNASFNESGFRLPMIVISPWVRPHFVSHVNRDNTAILKFIETRFNVPSLTARDAAQDNMLEFFDFSSPHLLTPPPLPAQPTNGTANPNLETHP